jgi:hypothetical protein
MIHYDLRCSAGHEFDGWFPDSAGFEAQAKAGFVECPVCGGTEVAKRLMAPAIPKKGRTRVKEVLPPPPPAVVPPGPLPGHGQAAAGPVPAQVVALLQRMRAEVVRVCPEDEAGFDQAFNNRGCRPSAAYVENLLTTNGFQFRRLDDPILNSDFHNYSWTVTESKEWRHGLRRFWVCWKNTDSPIAPGL